jgi:alpha-L-fucosidase
MYKGRFYVSGPQAARRTTVRGGRTLRAAAGVPSHDRLEERDEPGTRPGLLGFCVSGPQAVRGGAVRGDAPSGPPLAFSASVALRKVATAGPPNVVLGPGLIGGRLRWIATVAALVAASCGGAKGDAGGSGGSIGSGGSTATGGADGSGAGTGTGGFSGSGGSIGAGSGGSVATGGARATGGATGSGGRGGAATGSGGSSTGTAGSGGAGGKGGGESATGGAGGQNGGAAGTGPDGSGGVGAGGTGAKSLQQLQSDYVDMRCGSQGGDPCAGSWAQANLPIDNFAPSSKYDPTQWADTAVAAHMKFGVLTTRHHDGFALWPSAASTFNVGHVPWKNGKGDVVKDYVNAFRSRGLAPGLYYSIWDSTEGIGNSGTITAAQMSYVTTQLTELLTNYGPIPILVLDGWSWKTGHNKVAYQAIRELVKSLQPNCLVTDHTHLIDPWEVDIVNFEEPAGAFAPANNTYAAAQEAKINGSGGNDWFWAPNVGSLMTVSTIVAGHLKKLEPAYTNFLLNCPPNRDGLIDASMVSVLTQVGAAWSPNLGRAPLPTQARIIEHPYTPVAATATSGTAGYAIDGINDTSTHTLWQTSGALPQSVTLDLGQTRPDVGMLSVVPQYVNGAGVAGGNVTSYAIAVSTDGSMFTQAGTGTWPADGKLHTAIFGPVAARQVRFEVRAANGASAIVTDITVGANR